MQHKKKKIFLYGLYFFYFFSSSHLFSAPAKLPLGLQKIQAQYSQTQTLSMEFQQTFWNDLLQRHEESSGKILIKRSPGQKPFRFRWEIQKPQVQIFISDGKTFWHFIPSAQPGEKAQAVQQPSQEVQSQFLEALLSGQFSLLKDVTWIQPQPKDSSFFLLKPKPGSAGTLESLSIQLHLKQGTISKIVLHHFGGNRAILKIQKTEFGKPLSDSLFSLNPSS